MANDETKQRKPPGNFWDWYSSLSQEQHGNIFGHAGYSLRPPELPQYARGGLDITPTDWNQTTNITQNFQNEYQVVQQSQLDSRGIPIDWDYRTSTTGPFGQALPQGAQGWDPYGRPDFGTGPLGWIKREWAEITGKVEVPEDQREALKPIDDDDFDTLQHSLWDEGKFGKWLGAWFGRATGELRYKWTDLEYSEKSPTALAVGSRVIGTAFTGLGEGLNQLARGAERLISPTMITGDEYIRAGRTAIDQEWLTKLNKIPVIRTGVKLLIGAVARLEDPEFENLADEYREAQIWRMGYSAALDVMTRNEYMRRYTQEHEDPRFLAMELENPVAELWGQLVFDPLNIAGAWFAKLNKARVAQKVGARGTKAIGAFGNVMDDVKGIVNLVDEFADAPKFGGIVEKVQEGFKAARQNLTDLAERRGIATLTAMGKRTEYMADAGHFLNTMSQHFAGNTDDFLEWISSMVKLSGSVDETTEALATLGRITKDASILEMSFSEMGTKTSLILREILTDPKTGELIEASKLFGTLEDGADMAAFAEKAAKKIASSTERLFPTLTEQIAKNDELLELIAKYGDESEEVAQYLARNPLADVPIPGRWRTIDKAHQTAQKFIYRPAAGVQGVLYMGLSPAYWLRNRFTNFAQIFIDQGAKTAFKSFFSPIKAAEEIESYLGFLPKIEGFGSAASFSGKPGDGVLRFFSQRAASDEAAAATHVMATSIRDTMSKGLIEGRIIPSTANLFGFSNDMRSGIVRLAQRFNGDVDEVLKALREAKKVGGFDISRNLTFLSTDDVHDMGKLGIYSRVQREVLEAEDLQSALNSLDNIADDYAKAAAEHAKQPTITIAMNELGSQIDEATKGVLTTAQRERLKDLIGKKMHANGIARRSSDKAIESIRLEAGIAMGQQLPGDKIDNITHTITSAFDGLLDDLTDKAVLKRDTLLARTWDFSDAAKGVDDPSVLRRLWYESGLQQSLGDMPTGITSQQLRNELWENFYPSKMDFIWNNHRDAYVSLRQQEGFAWVSALQEEGADFPWQKLDDAFDNTSKEYAVARSLDSAVMRDGKMYVKYTPEMELVELAKRPRVGMTDEIARATADERWEIFERIAKEAEEEGKIAVYHARGVDEEGLWVSKGHGVIAREPSSALSEARVAFIEPEKWDEIRGLADAKAGGYQPEVGFIPIDDADVKWQQIGSSPEATLAEDALMTRLRGGVPEAGRAASEATAQGALDEINQLEFPEDIRFDTGIEYGLTGQDQAHVRISNLTVSTEARGQGLASRALEDLKGIADEHGTPLMVEPGVFKEGGLSTEELVAWYKRKGFEELYPNVDEIAEITTQKYIYVPEGYTTEIVRASESRMTQLAGVEPPHYKRLVAEVPEEVADRFIPFEEYFADKPLPVSEDVVASPSQNAFQTKHYADELLARVRNGLEENWGSLRDYTFTPAQEKELRVWLGEMRNRTTIARSEALNIAQETRDFILHNYPKRYGIDTLLSYIYPYQFWHSRTYTKWMKRIVMEPEWIARYAKYRQFLEKSHAGLPDWWKYQLNTNELLGMDSEEPIWFNLEATLNPLYGMTGVDFSDRDRRQDWWGSTMEDLNKLGPSVWTPYQLALAVHYHNQGKEEAAAKWAGRSFTGTKFIRDVTALMGFNKGKGVELDPLINFFSGGLGPWERAKVGRVLGGFISEGRYSEAEIIDAGNSQSGPIWEEAVAAAINERAPGNIASFLFGAGFKPRSERDIQIDRMYNEINGLRSQREFLSDEEYRKGWSDLRNNYPFMDTVLLSKKSGLDRDEAYAWNVLGRIPPGATDELAEQLGINYDDIGFFYDNKGDLREMPEAQRLRFMAAILDLSALLDMPTAATRNEWDFAKTSYKNMRDIGETLFGDDIWDKVDAFYASEDRDSFLRSNPSVEFALDWQQETIIQTPALAAYYTSIAKIEKYLKGQMYDEAEGLFGESLWDHFEVYYRLKDADSKAARQYWKDHPQLDNYMDFKEQRLPYIAERLNELGSKLPEGLPASFREELEVPPEEITRENDKEAWLASQVVSYLGGGSGVPYYQQQLSDEELQQMMGEPLFRLWQMGVPLPEIAKRRLQELGLSEYIQ